VVTVLVPPWPRNHTCPLCLSLAHLGKAMWAGEHSPMTATVVLESLPNNSLAIMFERALKKLERPKEPLLRRLDRNQLTVALFFCCNIFGWVGGCGDRCALP
jgi:hypothetical protein